MLLCSFSVQFPSQSGKKFAALSPPNFVNYISSKYRNIASSLTRDCFCFCIFVAHAPRPCAVAMSNTRFTTLTTLAALDPFPLPLFVPPAHACTLRVLCTPTEHRRETTSGMEAYDFLLFAISRSTKTLIWTAQAIRAGPTCFFFFILSPPLQLVLTRRAPRAPFPTDIY